FSVLQGIPAPTMSFDVKDNAIRERLATHDRLAKWNYQADFECSLCKNGEAVAEERMVKREDEEKGAMLLIANRYFEVFKASKVLLVSCKAPQIAQKPLRKLLYDYGNIHDTVDKLQHELDEAPKALDFDPIPMAFIDHYMAFLGQQGVTSHFNSSNLFCNVLSNDVANHMVRDVSDQEIREAIFAIGDNKASGPDGYSTAFFKEA
ncbi:hypothetical protein Tco_1027547, partial [Tanacetum coccineum]